MNAEEKLLYERLARFEIDAGPVAMSFATRLARENGWSTPFAERVVVEYKRFLFLAARAGHPVTPSDQVDQAWHLHLSYTRSYWDRLCRQILDRPFHHDPTEGGEVENRKFDNWYHKTLASYERFFGESPPAEIWPPPAIRFGIDPRARRVNTVRNLILPRMMAKRWAAILALGILATASIGASSVDPSFAIIAATLFVTAMVLVVILVRRKGGGGKGGAGGAGCGGVSGCGGGCGSGCGGGGCGGGGCGGS